MSDIKICVVLAGLLESYQHDILEGIISQSKKDACTIHIYQCINGDEFKAEFDDGEYNIFSLCNFEDYDGVIVLSNTILHVAGKKLVDKKIKECKCPVVTIDCKTDGSYFVGIDNIKAEKMIVNHLIKEHDCKDIFFIKGKEINTEAEARFEGYKEALCENGIEYDSKKVYQGSFIWQDGQAVVEKLIASGKPLPDAIVCSNDVVATSTFVALLRHGIKVPEQIKVTGFDKLQNKPIAEKWITTVERDLIHAGELSVDTIAKICKGEKVSHEQYIDFNVVFTGSCGCNTVPSTHLAAIDAPDATVFVRNSVYDFCRMLSGVNCYTTMPEIVEALKPWINKIDCSEFYICLCDDWEGKEAFPSSENEQCFERFNRIDGYSDRVQCVLNYQNGKFFNGSMFDRDEIMPGGGSVTEEKFYVISPLHFQEKCFGYCVVSNNEFKFEDGIKLTTYCHNITNALEIIRRQNQLKLLVKKFNRISMSDGLTGIYNRSGFLNLANNVIDSNFAKATPMFVAYFDLDGLKTINDSLGHEEGDTAIKALANALQTCSKHNDICGRLGGDEFALLGVGYTAPQIDEFMNTVTKTLEVYNEHSSNKFTVSTSYGYHAFNSSEGMSLSDCLDIADGKMYRHKYEKKKNRVR